MDSTLSSWILVVGDDIAKDIDLRKSKSGSREFKIAFILTEQAESVPKGSEIQQRFLLISNSPQNICWVSTIGSWFCKLLNVGPMNTFVKGSEVLEERLRLTKKIWSIWLYGSARNLKLNFSYYQMMNQRNLESCGKQSMISYWWVSRHERTKGGKDGWQFVFNSLTTGIFAT